MATYRFDFLGEPKSKGRPKFCRRGKFAMAYTPKETREAEEDIKSQLVNQVKAYGMMPLKGAIIIRIYIIRAKPKSARKKDIYPTKRPDLDNYIKLVLDAMNTIVFVDDSQIVILDARKQFGEQPKTHVIVEELE